MRHLAAARQQQHLQLALLSQAALAQRLHPQSAHLSGAALDVAAFCLAWVLLAAESLRVACCEPPKEHFLARSGSRCHRQRQMSFHLSCLILQNVA